MDPSRHQELSFYYKNLGLASYHLGEMDAALSDYGQAIDLNETNADNYFNRGNVYLYQAGQHKLSIDGKDYEDEKKKELREKEFMRAHQDFDYAIELDPTNAKLYHAKGLVFQEQSEALTAPEDFEEKTEYIREAIIQFSKALDCCDTFISSMFHKGLMYRRISEYTAALELFSRVLELLPGDETVYIQRGLVYQDMGNNEQAIKDFMSAIDVAGENSCSCYYLGLSYLKSKYPREALKQLTRAGELPGGAENLGISDAIGQAHHQLRDYEQAVYFYTEAINEERKHNNSSYCTNVDFLSNRARCYYDDTKYEEATEDLDEALKHDERDSKVHYQQGLTWYAFGKYKKCIKSLKKALAYQPLITHEPDIYYHLGLSYCRLQKFEKSIFPFSRCIERVPSDLRYIHERAKAYQMIEYHEKAVEDFDVVAKKNPKNAHAYFRRAFSLKALKVSASFGSKTGVKCAAMA